MLARICAPFGAIEWLYLPKPIDQREPVSKVQILLKLEDVSRKLKNWRRDYNEPGPHGAFGNQTSRRLMDRGVATSAIRR